MNYSLIRSIAISALVLAACGDDGGGAGTSTSTTDASTGNEPTTGTPTSTSAATSSSTGADSGSGTAADSGSGTAAATGSGTAADSGSGSETAGASCGTEVCSDSEYCDWVTNSCGTQEIDEGHCMPRPDGCPDVSQPVCACDGTVYGNECDAQAQGVDVDALSSCEAPEGTFTCGYRYCDPTLAYCNFSPTDVLPAPDGYACVGLPVGCGDAPDCECLADEPCAMFGCEATPDGGLQIICPGG